MNGMGGEATKVVNVGDMVHSARGLLESGIYIRFTNKLDTASGSAVGSVHHQRMIIQKTKILPMLSNTKQSGDRTKITIVEDLYKGLLLTIVSILLESPGNVDGMNKMRMPQCTLTRHVPPAFTKKVEIPDEEGFGCTVNVEDNLGSIFLGPFGKMIS
jgi:hypothetical protein